MTAPSIPNSLVLSLVSATESILLLFAFPHIIPEASLKGLFFIFASLNFGAFAVWRVIIYPFFISPLRHLPGPKGFSQVSAMRLLHLR
jgi:hypothetical protein